jgi:membrane-bound serine protease (ClpP class)
MVKKQVKIFGLCVFLCLCLANWAEAEGNKVYILPVSGTVDPGMAAYVKRALAEVKADTDAVVLLKMDTFGGRVDAALDIVESMSSLPGEKTFAFVEKRAISAGALIALSAGTLVMAENTLIGDCAPMIQTSEGMKEAGEKMQTVLRAQFRTLARRNGYPQVLAEAMVSKDMAVYQITMDDQIRYMTNTAYGELSPGEKDRITEKKTIVSAGQLLTMDDKEASDLGFSRASIGDLASALSVLDLAGRQPIEIQESWSETFVRMIQPFLPILMLVGMGALYTEIKAPGFGIPGAIGILCLGLVFFNQYLVGLANYTEFLVLIIGVLLLGVEVLVLPGFGIAGIAGLAVIAAGLILSFQGFVLPDPALPWEAGLMLKNAGRVTASFLGAFLISFFLIRFVLPRTSKLVKGPYLSASLAGARAESFEALTVVAGQTGVSVTPLRPAGKIRTAAGKVDAMTQGDFIEPDQAVVVVSVSQNHVIVQKVEKAP